MRFAFTDDQLRLRAAVRQVLERHCTPADLRTAIKAGATPAGATPVGVTPAGATPAGATPVGVTPAGAMTARAGAAARWSALSELGVAGMLVPERFGGIGLEYTDWIGVAEECGRAALPEPLVPSASVAAPMLSRVAAGFGDPGGPGMAGARSALGALAAGDLLVAVGGFEPTAESMTTTTRVAISHPSSLPARSLEETVYTDRVLGAGQAGLYLLAWLVPGGQWQLHAVEAGELRVAARPSLDGTRRLGEIEWTPRADTRLATGAAAALLLSDAADRASVSAAAELCGLADRLVSMTAAYATERKQFGRPVGSFQAVKHHLANARIRLEFARPAVYRAADSLTRSLPRRSEHASMAKALASDAADLACRVALQVHGAIGYTWECDLHLYMKRAWALSAAWGDATSHRSRVLTSALERLTS